ncbi:MAG: ATP-dependent acyl-CoA ligase [Alphaproteobacteria bacterium]|nr:ATP-dependent acyl-CoA ligase [Alphaproteobacteria bacterium]
MRFRTVFEAFLANAARAPGNAFLCAPAKEGRAYHPLGVEYSYAEAVSQVMALQSRYLRAGYGHGHRVALLLENRPEFFFHYLALNGLGVGIVPVNPDYRHEEMLYQMEHSAADLAVTVPERRAAMEAVAQERQAGKPLPVATPGEVADPAFTLARPTAPPPLSGPPGPESECGLLYTSGTTGRPKGCVLSNFYYLNSGQWYLDMGERLTLRPGQERVYNPLPLYHMNCQAVTATAMILSANCLILPDRFHPASWWKDVVSTRATAIHYLGVVPPLLLNQPKTKEERRHKVRFGLGAGIEPELHRAFEERFGFPLVEVWGMTETGRIFADHIEPRAIETRAFGRPGPGLEAKVVDDDDLELPRGKEGELLVRHSAGEPRRGFFSGYFKNEAATEEAWRGGWFHTGDTVRQDDSGMLIFVDRKKNIIRRSGENIAAAEIEACLQAHEAVAQVAVLAVKDELREEEVMACVVPMKGVAPGPELADKLMAWCLSRLAYYKAPGWWLFVESLPTTGTQKVQKAQIFPPGEDPRGRPGAVDLRPRKRR